MTIRQVAKAAGVSPATVSRVLNSAPNIAAATAQAVHRAVAEMNYAPTRRRRQGPRASTTSARGARVGFYIVEYNPESTNPAYEKLLRGVTQTCEQLQFDVQVGFIDAEDDVVQRLSSGRFDGLLLHGTPPSEQASQPLHDIPTVWLMGGRYRPAWGDQVMPDNDSVALIASKYLLEKGHKHVAYYGVDSGWSLHVRCRAFERAVREAGAQITVQLEPLIDPQHPKLPDVYASARKLIKTLRTGSTPPTALFIAEDWLLRSFYAVAAEEGIRIGTDLTIISCNNDRPHLEGLSPKPPTIDIRIDRIASRGVEQLAYRLQRSNGNNVGVNDRLRILVEPTLVSP